MMDFDDLDDAEEETRSTEDEERRRLIEEQFKPPPTRGKFVASSTGRPRVQPWVPRLADLPARLRTITPFDDHLKGKSMEDFNAAMEALGSGMPKGHFYGIEFPYTLDQIRSAGAPWLTKAMHTAGTLPRDNSVVSIEVETFIGGSMSQKCFLTVEYATPGEGLLTRLFVKYPFAAETGHDRKAVYVARFFINNDGPEMDFMRILSAGAPIASPKYVYGDICMKTGTALLISERLDLPHQSTDFGPYELEPIPYKSVDYLLDDPFPYYDMMTRNVGKLAAWAKSGRLGFNIDDVFPPNQYPAAMFMGTKKRATQYIKFYQEIAPKLLPAGMVDEAFATSMLEVMPEVERNQKQILDYLFARPDYNGPTHQNMNTDNAFFWRDDEGKVESGFIDWGRFKQDNYARGMVNGYMCCDLNEFVQTNDQRLLRGFIEAYQGEGGPRLDFELMWEHYLLSWLLMGLLIVDNPRQFSFCDWLQTPESWADIESYQDPRIFRMPNYSNGSVTMANNFAWYWKMKDLPSFWRRWKSAHLPAKK